MGPCRAREPSHRPLAPRGRYGGSVCLALCAALPGSSWGTDAPSIEGITIATYQTAKHHPVDGIPVRSEGSGALDLLVRVPVDAGFTQIEIRGASTPRLMGVTSALPEVNASVGETLDNHDQGRVVAWQAFFQHELGPGSLALGLIDASGWLDGNEVANDEFTQFLGASFVNNLTIDLPSATLGAVYTSDLGGAWGLTTLVANATGIEPDYEQAFRLGERGNGVFTAIELQWSTPRLAVNLGAWGNTRRHDSDGDGIDDERLKDAPARGLYANLSGRLGHGQWNLRLGQADARVQAATRFLGLAYSLPIGDSLLGMGMARTYASSHLPERHADLIQAEAYLRVPLGAGLTVSPDVQYIRHSGFSPAEDGTWVVGMRAGWSF